ncbi:hypothetical protein N7488_005577 [Penicillium malachiteum]|nr:hypothetical protein N7488_005577 [Penicillium malachiteum]
MAPQEPLPSVTTRTVPGPAPNGMGNGLFATEDIKVGEDVVHAKTPFVAILDSARLEDTCSGCFGKRQMAGNSDLKACTGCRVVKYCDRTCQAKDWKFAHSMECKIFQKLKPQILPNNARAILRMVLRTGKGKYTPQELGVFSNLETHITEIQQNQTQMDRVSLTAQAVKGYSETDMTEEAICAYAARLDLNSFNLTTALYDRIGLYLHPYAALINHSCDYNATVGFDGEELFIKAIKPIKKHEQIFISYIDTTTPLQVRRSELSERYYFTCACPKCSKGPNPNLNESQNESLSTSPNTDDNPTAIVETAERDALELLHAASDSDADPSTSIKSLKKGLSLLASAATWSLSRQPYPQLRDQIILSYLSTNSFSAAFIHAAIRYLRVDPLLYSPAHPIRHLHAWILAKLAIYLSQSFETKPDDPVRLEDFQLNFHFILWYVLADLASRQMESCTVPSFRTLVGANFKQVNDEFRAQGIDLGSNSQAKALLGGAWANLERLVDAALEKESEPSSN